MFKLLAGAALGFAAAWFMDTKEGENRRALVKDKGAVVKDKAAGYAGKAKQQATNGGSATAGAGESYESATSGEPLQSVESDPATAPGPETFKQD
jgi:gas vesicle protein